MSRWPELKELIKEQSIAFGDFVLASGQKSDVYIDIRKTSLHPKGAYLIGKAFSELIFENWPDAKGVGGLTLGADPLVTATSIVAYLDNHSLGALIVRKDAKSHGTRRAIESPGILEPGDHVIVVDDVVTSGGSTLQAVHALREAGFIVKHALAVVDRQAGAEQNLSAHGITLQSLFIFPELVQR